MESNVSDLSALNFLRSMTKDMNSRQQSLYEGTLLGVLSVRVEPIVFDYCVMTALEFHFRANPQAYKNFLQIKWSNVQRAAKDTAVWFCDHFNIDTEHEPGPTCPVCEIVYLLEPLHDQLLGTIECPRLS